MAKQSAAIVTIPFRINKRAPLIMVPGSIDGHGPIDFIIDTGASGTVISREVAKRASIGLGGARAKAAGPDGSQTVIMAKLDLLQLGALQVRNFKVAVMDFALLNRAAKMNAGVILGYDFLRLYEFTINYPGRWIRFRPLQQQKPAPCP